MKVHTGSKYSIVCAYVKKGTYIELAGPVYLYNLGIFLIIILAYFCLYLSKNRFEMQYHLCLCQERHVWRVSWTCLLIHFGQFCVFGSVLLSVFESKDV